MVQKVNPNQGEMLVLSGHSDQVVTKEFYDDPSGLQLEIEKKLHMQNVLSATFKVNMLRPFVSNDEIAYLEYGEGEAPKVLTGAAINLRNYITSAKHEFAMATGHYDRIKDGEDPEQVKNDTRAKYSDFLKKYAGARNTKAAHVFRKQLVSEVEALSADADPEAYVSEYNRAKELRPYYKPVEEAKSSHSDDSEEQAAQLSNRERLLSFMMDPRAGFVPKHNGELDQMLSWLDYLDNPEYPLGINNQLGEVFGKGRWPRGKSKVKGPWLGDEFGVRAVESIAWKVGDFLLESQARLRALQELGEFVKEEGSPELKLFELCNQTDGEVGLNSLPELFGEHWFGLAAMVQYSDITEYIDTGEVKALAKHPLSTTEDPPRSQRPKYSAVPGKRKTTLNHYTGGSVADPTGEYGVHIIAKLKQMTVKDARKIITNCIQDVSLENSFMRRRMNELWDFDQGDSAPVYKAVHEVRSQLKQLETA